VTTVYLALGANLGNRRANLAAALERLRLGGKFKVRAVSGLYETRPVGYINQPDFLNMALEGETELSPFELLDSLKRIELLAGRDFSAPRNYPRPLDLDILFYGDHLVNEDRLQVPHPRLHERAFVLAPLEEFASRFTHPQLQSTIEDLLTTFDLEKEGVYRYRAEPDLQIPLPRFLFVTGRLAAPVLEQFLHELSAQLNFTYGIAKMDMDVAAFMSVRYIADHLKLPEEECGIYDLLVIPGWAKGDLASLERTSGIKAALGPTDLTELESWLELQIRCTKASSNATHYYTEEQLRELQTRLTDSNIRIFTDGKCIYAFNNQLFVFGGIEDKELRTLFRQLGVDNASHAFYLGRELYKAAMSIRLGLPYHQDRDLEL
jgi:2-amino-4-hydroxy-6-hydroxymethyldihydropteridine diphosphokinase